MIMMLLTRKIHLDTELGIVDLAHKVEVRVHELAFGREYREALEIWESVCPTGVLISDCSECLTDVDPEIGGHVAKKLKSNRTLLMVCIDIGLDCGAINDLDRGPRRRVVGILSIAFIIEGDVVKAVEWIGEFDRADLLIRSFGGHVLTYGLSRRDLKFDWFLDAIRAAIIRLILEPFQVNCRLL